jgi:hypothetical protein
VEGGRGGWEREVAEVAVEGFLREQVEKKRTGAPSCGVDHWTAVMGPSKFKQPFRSQ